MCVLGKELEKFERDSKDPIIGYRNWRIDVKNSKNLISLNCDFIWNGEVSGKIDEIIEKEIPSGIYCYNNYYNYNNNNYNNYYNYYNYYYNYNNYNNYYNYINYINYYIIGQCYQYGEIVKHEKGFRSSLAYPKSLVILDNPRWFEGETERYANHFNDSIKKIAENYGERKVEIIGWSEFQKIKE